MLGHNIIADSKIILNYLDIFKIKLKYYIRYSYSHIFLWIKQKISKRFTVSNVQLQK